MSALENLNLEEYIIKLRELREISLRNVFNLNKQFSFLLDEVEDYIEFFKIIEKTGVFKIVDNHLFWDDKKVVDFCLYNFERSLYDVLLISADPYYNSKDKISFNH